VRRVSSLSTLGEIDVLSAAECDEVAEAVLGERNHWTARSPRAAGAAEPALGRPAAGTGIHRRRTRRRQARVRDQGHDPGDPPGRPGPARSQRGPRAGPTDDRGGRRARARRRGGGDSPAGSQARRSITGPTARPPGKSSIFPPTWPACSWPGRPSRGWSSRAGISRSTRMARTGASSATRCPGTASMIASAQVL